MNRMHSHSRQDSSVSEKVLGNRLNLAPRKPKLDERQLWVVTTSFLDTRNDNVSSNPIGTQHLAVSALSPKLSFTNDLNGSQRRKSSGALALGGSSGKSPSATLEMRNLSPPIPASSAKERIDEIHRRLSNTSRPSTGSLHIGGFISREGSTASLLSPTGRKFAADGTEVRFVGGSRLIGVSKGSSGAIVPSPGIASPPGSDFRKTPMKTPISETDRLATKLADMRGSGSGEFEAVRDGLTSPLTRHSLDAFKAIETCGPLACKVLTSRRTSPFTGRDLSQITPPQISVSMMLAYSSHREIARASTFQATANDIIVVSPPRTGQTSVLRVIDMLLHQGTVTDFSEKAFAGRTGWIGSAFPAAKGETRRLFKTHLPLETFFNGSTGVDASPKIVVVLRDPVAVRESWFNHCKAVFEHYNPGMPFTFDVNDFVAELTSSTGRGSHDIGQSGSGTEGVDAYERFVASVLTYIGRSNLMVVFYEDLMKKPATVVGKLCDFLAIAPSSGRNRSSLKTVTKVVSQARETKCATSAMPTANRSVIAKIQNRWDYQIATKGPWRFPNYDAFYNHFSLLQDYRDEGASTRKMTIIARMTWIGRPRSAFTTQSDPNGPSTGKPRRPMLHTLASLFERPGGVRGPKTEE